MKRSRFDKLYKWMKDENISIVEILIVIVLSNSVIGVGLISLGNTLRKVVYDMANKYPQIDENN